MLMTPGEKRVGMRGRTRRKVREGGGWEPVRARDCGRVGVVCGISIQTEVIANIPVGSSHDLRVLLYVHSSLTCSCCHVSWNVESAE